MVHTFGPQTEAATFVLQNNGGGTLRKLEGYCNGAAAQYFIHIFDAIAVPANTTVPKRSLQVIGANGTNAGDGFTFSFEDSELTFGTGICFALSSTDATYTAVVDSAVAQWQGEWDTLRTNRFIESSLTTVGDMTIPRDFLNPWADAAGGAKHLYEVRWNNRDDIEEWLMLFATDSVSAGQKPFAILAHTNSASDVIVPLFFGTSGLVPQTMVNGVLKQGCYLAYSSTGNVLTQVTGSNNLLMAKFK